MPYMKKSSNHPFGYIVTLVFAVTALIFFALDIPLGKQLVWEFSAFSCEVVPLLLCIFILIGLLDVWIPKQLIQQHVGEESGFCGVVYVVLLAMFQGGPLYGAFPTAHLLWKKGCSMRNVFVYLGAFSSLKIPMMLIEVNFLGWRFTFVRAAIALPVFMVSADLMARYSRKKGLQMRNILD